MSKRFSEWLNNSSSLFGTNHHFPGLENLILLGLTSLGVGGAGLNWLVPALTALATTAVTVGLSYLTMPKPPKPADGKAPKVQPIPPRIFGVGTNRIGGYYMLWEEKDNWLCAVAALCGHPVSAFKKIWLHDDVVNIDATATGDREGLVTGSLTNPDPRYTAERIFIQTRKGAVPETPYPWFVSHLGPDDVWTADHRGDGQASLSMRCKPGKTKDFSSAYPYGIPQPSAEMDLAEVWDFRDPAQSPTNPATWTFSRNAALCLVWWLCFCEFGPKWNYVKAILPVIDRWKEEADICDEDVPRASGGTEKRYQVDGWGTTETDPIAIQNCLLAACDGHLAQHGDGTLILTVGKFREYLVETITDRDIVGHYRQTDVPEEDEINRLTAKFTYPETDYSEALTDYYEDPVAQQKIGRPLAQEASFSWVQSWRQARRLLKREWLRIQEKQAGSFDLRLSAVNAATARWIRVKSPLRLPSLNGKLIENRRAILALQQGGFQMEWKKHPDNIDAWDPVIDEGRQPPVPDRPSSTGLPVPVVNSVTAIGGNGSVYLRVVVVQSDTEDLIPVVRYRIKDTGGGSPGAWVQQPFDTVNPSGGFFTLDTAPVPNDQRLQVEVLWQASKGTFSAPSTPTQEVVATVDTVPPVALLTVSASGGAGKYTVNFGTANDTHLVSVAIYRVPTGNTLNKVTHLAAKPAVSRGISYSIPVTSSTGNFDIYAEPLNGSAIAGPLAGAFAVTVT